MSGSHIPPESALEDPSLAIASPSQQSNFNVPIRGHSSGGSPATATTDQYLQQVLQGLNVIQQAHNLTPQQCQFIVQANIRGIMEGVAQRNFATAPGGVSAPTTLQQQESIGRTGIAPAATPLTRTESCPLPSPPSTGKSQIMRREHSSLNPPLYHDFPGADAITAMHNSFSEHKQMQTEYPEQRNTQGQSSSSQFVVNSLAPSLPSLPIQQISAPEHGLSMLFPLSIEGYVNQNPRDDPFSSLISGNCWPRLIGSELNVEASFPEQGQFDFCTDPTNVSQHSPPQPLYLQNLPYPCADKGGASFLAPRMEPQLSSSTFLESVSTNQDVDSSEDFIPCELGIGVGDDVQCGFEDMHMDLSASQITIRPGQIPQQAMHEEEHTTPAAPASSQDAATNLPSAAIYPQPDPVDLQFVPELTNSVNTPQTPAAQSVTNVDNGVDAPGLPGGYPFKPTDIPVANHEAKEWSRGRFSAISGAYQGGAANYECIRLRKRSHQSLLDDIGLLVKGVHTTETTWSYDAQLPGEAELEGIVAHLNEPTSLRFETASGGSVDSDAIFGESPKKVRKVDGWDFKDAQSFAQKSPQERTVKSIYLSQSFPGFPATTRPLPDLDEDLAMRRSKTKQPPTLPNVADSSSRRNTTIGSGTTSTVSHKKVPSATSTSPTRPISIPNQQAPRSYVRRPHPRVYCTQCNDVRDGFRGDHELRRHQERVHAPTKKVWVTKDISPNGDFLSGCKSCNRGKHYYADYNAAAHLRRQHFCKEGKRGRSRKEREEKKRANIEKVKAKLEKWGIDFKEDCSEVGGVGRGGVGRSGEEFSLRFLRNWMRQIEIPRATYENQLEAINASQSDEEEGSDENEQAKQEQKLTALSKDGPMGTIRPVWCNGSVTLRTAYSAKTSLGGFETEKQDISPPFDSAPTQTLLAFDLTSQDFLTSQAFAELDSQLENSNLNSFSPLSQEATQLTDSSGKTSTEAFRLGLEEVIAPTRARVDVTLEPFYRYHDGIGSSLYFAFNISAMGSKGAEGEWTAGN
ncbi:hypothetical protein BDZ91DRAFT_762621 [Kalaharituber pfeilii]|nr:hypothetical protein BDZ91DRAFT_762621 [Kalaharituber pfeilii]